MDKVFSLGESRVALAMCGGMWLCEEREMRGHDDNERHRGFFRDYENYSKRLVETGSLIWGDIPILNQR
ncbi:unnamed protein product [Prunus armeniaca]